MLSLLLFWTWSASPTAGVAEPQSARPAAAAPAAARGNGLILRSLRSGGRTRWYRVYQPTSYNPAVPAPVVLGFHGGGGDARQFADQSGLCATAERYGFLAVFPEGTGALGGWPLFLLETWNAGDCCGYAVQNNVDDVGFVGDLLSDLETQWNVAPGWVFATGHSNGGLMAYRLAIDLPHLIAAIAPNAAALAVDKWPPAPIPVLAFHGKLDCNVPFQGGVGCGVSGTDFKSQEDSLKPFLKVNQAQVPNPLAPAEVRGQAWRFEAPAPATGADVHYWWLLDHGHSWPGHGSGILGEPTNFDIDANEELWAFFASHHR